LARLADAAMLCAPMNYFRRKCEGSPEYARVAPFVIFVVLTALQGQLGEDSRYWLYLIKTLVGAWLIWEIRPFVAEMRWAISWEALVAGIAVFAIWVGLDGLYPRLSEAQAVWNPDKRFGSGSALAWLFIAVRIGGSSIVVPPLEEVFYRSFLYRVFVKTDFRAMPLGQFHGLSFVVTSAIFGLMHPDRWVAGILCGLTYQWLVIRKNRLGDAMTAHALTNFLLGLWVVWKGAWSFW
jgi:CAAX prenyl protease-like protein